MFAPAVRMRVWVHTVLHWDCGSQNHRIAVRLVCSRGTFLEATESGNMM